MHNNNDAVSTALAGLLDNYRHPELCSENNRRCLPDRYAIQRIVQDLLRLMFPGYFDEGKDATLSPSDTADRLLCDVYYRLKQQVMLALHHRDCTKDPEAETEDICNSFIRRIPHIQALLLKDMAAGFNGDPAAQSREEIIFCYPGFYAIAIYRLAHELYLRQVPLIPRMMTEESHSRTGIDINPGATIGEYFFIDHGTGVVIGETTVIGNNVKLYQGVTLGALSTKPGQALAGVRRHPTVEDNVTVYAGATILGGDTVIGESSVIGGNCFITEPIPKNTKVIAKLPELTLRPGKSK